MAAKPAEDALKIEERFLRQTGEGRWDVYGDGQRLGTVFQVGEAFRARTLRGDFPLPSGGVRRPSDGGEPEHATREDAARMLVQAIESGRICKAQIAYERAHGWSTD